MSEVKVNKISPRTACGTVTLGDSGDTFTIPSGATITNAGTASGFGATGAVSWDTSSIKTAGFTATAGIGYFCNTTGGIFTVALPAGNAGDVVGVADYAQTFNTNNLTVAPDGSEKIGGLAADAIMSVNGVAATLVYVDGTQGWVVTDSGSSTDVPGPLFITATGGTPCSGAIVCTNYKVHTFTGPGTLCVSCGGNSAGSNTVDYMVVAGGGGSTSDRGGGGGAGGFRESSGTASGCYTASPLGAGVAASPVTAQGYPIVVGGGGAGGCSPQCGLKGSDSTGLGVTSTGGGFGLYNKASSPTEGPGGSGGGGGYSGGPNAGGVGNDPPTNPAQGFPGGTGSGSCGGAGGGGATVIGGNPDPTPGPGVGGIGGTGATSSINATPTARAGGGGGSSNATPAAGGTGGGGTGFGGPSGGGGAGTVNTGGGGGGSRSAAGGAGGSGVVIIRYKFQ
jgi:hypothetical protein